MLNLPLYYNNQIFKQSWKYHKSIKSCVLFISLHQYVVMVATFSQCLSLIQLNAQENEWLIAIKNLLKEKIARKKNLMIQFVVNIPMLINWVQIEMGKTFFKYHTNWSQK